MSRDIPGPSGTLNHRQRAFVAHYLTTLNGAEAARRAGYSEARARKTGSELLANPAVRALIEAAFEESIPSAAESLARIGARARSDMADIAAGLGHEELLQVREAGLDTRVIQRLRFHRPREPAERPVLASIELYNAHQADQDLLKVASRLEGRLQIVLEGEADQLVARLEAAFAGDPDGLAKVVEALAPPTPKGGFAGSGQD